jgi:transposase InsO family protein
MEVKGGQWGRYSFGWCVCCWWVGWRGGNGIVSRLRVFYLLMRLGKGGIFQSQGIPRVLLSDRDSKFKSVFWEQLFELVGTKLLYSASYHYQSNGQVERLNQTLTKFHRSYCGQRDQD